MEIRTLIPKHKSDFESVNALKQLKLEEIRPILPDLMEWLQDLNWPIAQEIESLLLGFQGELIPHIQRVFRTDDAQWKYFILHGLIQRLPPHIVQELKVDLERMLHAPSSDEKYEELDDVLIELLAKIK